MSFLIKSLAWFVLLVCVPAPLRGQDARVAKAREERKVVVYNTTTVPDMQKISDAFRKKYPFLEVESYRSAGERLIQKILRGFSATGPFVKTYYCRCSITAAMIWTSGRLGLTT